VLVEAVAGLALLGALGASLASAVAAPEGREAAAVTFVVTAAGAGFLGLGSAFWGLVAGSAVMLLGRRSVGVEQARPPAGDGPHH
jgi:benzoate membrane transport protein